MLEGSAVQRLSALGEILHRRESSCCFIQDQQKLLGNTKFCSWEFKTLRITDLD